VLFENQRRGLRGGDDLEAALSGKREEGFGATDQDRCVTRVREVEKFLVIGIVASRLADPPSHFDAFRVRKIVSQQFLSIFFR